MWKIFRVKWNEPPPKFQKKCVFVLLAEDRIMFLSSVVMKVISKMVK